MIGDTRKDLIARLDHMIEQYDRVGGMSIIGSCLAAEPRSAGLLEVGRRSTLLPRRTYFQEVFEAAQVRGELRRGIDLDLAVSVLVGAFYGDHLAGRHRHWNWTHQVVTTVLAGLLTEENAGR